MLVGLQARADTTVAATTLTVTLWDPPFRVAVMVAFWVVVTVPAVAVKVVEVLLAGTVTDAETGSAALLLESATVLPPAGAASFSVIVQVVETPEFRLVGLQARADTVAGSIRLNVASCMVPFKIAVTVADWFAVRTPAVATNVAEMAPTGTVA